MGPLKIAIAFGLGTMFGVMMSRGAHHFHCHNSSRLGHHPWRCHTQAHRKEVVSGAAQDEATLANN